MGGECMVKCQKCDHPVSEGDVFCNECGTRVEATDVTEESQEYCAHCGHESDNDRPFCVECGQSKETESEQPLDSDGSTVRDRETVVDQNEKTTMTLASGTQDQTDATAQENGETQTEETAETTSGARHPDAAQQQPQPAKKSMNKWKKSLILTGLLLVALAFGAYKYLEQHFDPLKDLVKMDEAILNDDVDGFMDFVRLDKAVASDKDAYFTYIQENEWNEGLKDEYYALIAREKENPTPLQKELISRYGTPLLKVKDEKKIFGLFKGYSLQAIPVQVSATTNLDGTEIQMMDDTYKIAKSDEVNELGEFYPGVYGYKATTEADYGEFVAEGTLEIAADEHADLEILFNYESFYIEVDYEFEDAIVFVNGESTEKRVNEIEEIGPIPLDSKVKFHAEWKDDKDKVFRSNTVEITEDDVGYIYLEFDERIALDAAESEDADYEVAEFILDFRSAYEYAVNYADYTEIADYMKAGSEEEEDLQKFIKDMGKANYYYEFEETTVTKVANKGDKKFEVGTSEQFTFHDEDGSVYEYDRDKVYFIESVDDTFEVYNIDYQDTKKKRVN